MKYTNKFALAGLLFASCSTYAATPAEGWYWGLTGGLSYTPSFSIESPNPLLGSFASGRFVFPGTIAFNPLISLPLIRGNLQHGVGGDFGGQVGYRICNFRLEGELVLNYSPLSLVQVGGITFKKHVSVYNPVRVTGQNGFGAAFFNAYYDFYDEENDPSWVPYLGLGIGYSSVRNSATFTIPYFFTNSVSYTARHNASTPMGQAIIGLSYYYSDYLSFGLDYRYMSTRNLAKLNGRMQTNALNLNFNYWFGD